VADMSRVFIHGWGAVSPAGWGVPALSSALKAGVPLPSTALSGTAGKSLPVRRVPPANPRPTWLAQPRLRRSSSISHFTVGAALEALAQAETGGGPVRRERLGIVTTVFTGGVSYSRRFFEEVLANPRLASPMLFPETVLNAPSSHLGAVLGSTAPNDTLVGDQTGFLHGLALAADWLAEPGLDAVLVVAAEEVDWLTATAGRLFEHGLILSEGAGALLLRRDPGPVELLGVTDPAPYVAGQSRTGCIQTVLDQMRPWSASATWRNPQIAEILGNGLAAAGAWTTLAAVLETATGAVETRTAALVEGANLQVLGAIFRRP